MSCPNLNLNFQFDKLQIYRLNKEAEIFRISESGLHMKNRQNAAKLCLNF